MIPSYYRKATLISIEHAEREKGSPVYPVEIMKAFLETQTIPIGSLLKLKTAIQELYKTDKVLACRQMKLYSLDYHAQETQVVSTGF
jgi:hypothetical protein